MTFLIKKISEAIEIKSLSEVLIQKLYPKDSPRFLAGFEPVVSYLEGVYFVFDNQVLKGRFALYTNPELLFKGQSTLCIGSYECTDEKEVSAAIFDFIHVKIKELKVAYLIGPMEGSTWEGYRFSNHHQNQPYLLEPYHHLYYNDHFKQNGLVGIGHYVSNYDEALTIDADQVMVSLDVFRDKGLIIRPIDMDNLSEELFRIGTFCNEAFSDNFLFTAIDPYYFAEKYLAVQKMFVPSLIQIAEDENGQIHGFAFAIPDHLNPENKTLIVKSMARAKNSPYKGLGGLLGGLTYLEGQKLGLRNAIHAFVYQDNPSLKVSGHYAGVDFTSYTLFGKKVN